MNAHRNAIAAIDVAAEPFDLIGKHVRHGRLNGRWQVDDCLVVRRWLPHINDGVAQANALPVSFQAAVFTQDIDTSMRLYKSLDASAVMINDHSAFRDDVMPFAGLRESGLGVGGIPYTMEDMVENKMVAFSL